MFDTKKLALFLGGVVFGSAGFKVLSSKDAKKVYTQTTAAVLRMKDCTMQTVNKVQEEAGDILADATAINEIAKRQDGGGHPLASGANSYSLEENEQIYQEINEVVAHVKPN